VSSLELVPDEDGRGGVTVMLDGSPQSYVDLRDPGHLAFEYVQHIAAVVDTLAPGPLGVTHVGGAGLTLARYVNAERPGSTQIVLEPDEALTEAVRRDLPLPRRHRIRVRPVDGLRGVAGLSDAGADVVVLDAYAGGRVPAELTTLEFLRDVRRVLRPSGVALLNVADEPGLRFVARVVAGAREAFGSVALIATHEVLKGKRFGNTVVVASASPLDLPVLRRKVAAMPFPTGLRADPELRRQLGTPAPWRVTDSSPSPPPPPLKGWRLR
jgi:spermidine synthase